MRYIFSIFKQDMNNYRTNKSEMIFNELGYVYYI